MSALYLVRHGQAGLRGRYDTLSDQGRMQTRLLGEYFAAQKIPFRAFYTGALARQQQTAMEICSAYAEMPAPMVDPCWNEFDLAAVFEGIAPQLAADDPEFGSHYQTLQAEAADDASTVHRRWTPADIAVVRAWMDERYRYNGESWGEFSTRVRSSMDTLRSYGSGDNIAVSTSATPISIWAGLALQLPARNIMRLAGVLYNASLTTLRFRDGELSLFSFNNVPHLADPALRTFR